MTDTPKLWRTGRTLGRTLYFGDEFRGVMDRAEDAKAVVEAMNAEPALSLDAGNGTSWPVRDCLAKLREAAVILLRDKDYDGHGWESIEHATRAAATLLATTPAPLAPPAPQSEPGRWLFEQVPVSLDTWSSRDTTEREVWAKVEADCAVRGWGGLRAELDSLRAELQAACADAAQLESALEEEQAAHQRTEASREDWKRLAESRAEMLMADNERKTWQHETMRLKAELAEATAAKEKAEAVSAASEGLASASDERWAELVADRNSQIHALKSELSAAGLSPMHAQRLIEARAGLAVFKEPDWEHHCTIDGILETERRYQSLKSELAAMAKVAEERKADVGQAHIENKRLRAVVAESLALQIQYGRIKAELESERAKSAELSGYRDKYAAILEKCRKAPGKCFCGVHISHVMSDEAVPVPPAAAPDGGGGEPCAHLRAHRDLHTQVDWCPDCGAICYGRTPEFAWMKPRPQTEYEQRGDQNAHRNAERTDYADQLRNPRPDGGKDRSTSAAQRDERGAEVAGASASRDEAPRGGDVGSGGDGERLAQGQDQACTAPLCVGGVVGDNICEQQCSVCKGTGKQPTPDLTQSEITRHAREDAQAAAEEARQIGEKLDAANREKAKATKPVVSKTETTGPSRQRLSEMLNWMNQQGVPLARVLSRDELRELIACREREIESLSEQAAGRESK